MQLSIAWIIFAYLCGSVSSAIIICKLMGLPDPRSTGSKNPGTTNVLRIGGKIPAALTLLFDAFKGFAPVMLAHLFGIEHQWLAWVAVAAIIGHLFPVFFKFQGGKGVATMLGVLLGLSWLLALAAIVTWLLIAALFRYSSLAALVATILTPAYAYWFTDKTYLLPLSIIAIIIILRHYQNIQRLCAGTESRIGQKKENSSSDDHKGSTK